MEERKEGGLNSPKTRSRSTKNAVGMENAAGFFFPAGVKNGRSLQGKLADGTVVEIEAGASFYTDPISDVRQMHMNVVKCSN
ncbi:hypothetical protein TNCV_4387451 [Trichonephila clavipes]|nr:hypothetical protein TNCV_4387451 [Trichonephila clavipes]